MALAHNRLGLENKSARIFCVRQVYKILPTSLGTFKPTFYTFYTSHLRWNPVFIIQTSDRTQYFTILQYNLHSRKIQDNRSTRALTGTVKKKFPKSPTYTAIQFSLLTSPKVECLNQHWKSYRLQHDEEFIVYFLFNGFISASFWVLLQAMFMSDWKQSAQRLKLHKRPLTINKGEIIRSNIYRDNNFHSRQQVLKCLWKSLFMF